MFDSPIVSKKIKTTLFSSNKPPRYSKEAKDFAKENFGDSFNMNLDTEASREKTPSPKKRSYEDHYNTMSIKKERKLFNKKDDLEMNEYYDQEEVRFMTTSKAKIGSLNDIYQSSRFMNDYEISEVIFYYYYQ